MEQDIITGTRFMGAMTLVILAVILIFVNRGKTQSAVYNKSRRLIFVGTMFLAARCIIHFVFHIREQSPTLAWAMDLMFFVAIMPPIILAELNLMRASHQVRRASVSFFVFQLICDILFIIAYCTGTLINDEQPYKTMTFAISIYYGIAQLIACNNLAKEMRKVKKRLDNEVLDECCQALRYTAFSMQLMMLLAVFFPWTGMIDNVFFNALIGFVFYLLYCWFLIRFMLYGTDMSRVINASDAIVEEMEKEAPSESEQKISAEEIKRLEAIIDEWLTKQEYTNPSLTIDLVTRELHVSSTLLNKYLNHKYGYSYRNWIPHLRIAYAQQVIREHPQYSNQAVADMCGFSNRTSFQRTFAELVGTTPKQWSDAQHSTHA